MPEKLLVHNKRPDIQGLRAVAVLSVVFYHANKLIPGGYLGVDIFFVVSGYVITGSILNHYRTKGRFSLIQFYWRRTVRLLPALGFMIAIVNIASFFVISPLGMQQNSAKTGIGSLLITSNFVITKINLNYFGLQIDTNPLVHTWSLAVEEQFYLLFPLILISIVVTNKRWKINPKLILIALASVSALVMLNSTKFESVQLSSWLYNYYSPLTRIWEFISGVIILFINEEKIKFKHEKIIKNISAIILVIILFRFDSSKGYPSPFLLIPIFISSLLLLNLNGKKGITVKILESKILNFIGDRSYSIYLWHWPMIVIAKYVYPDNEIVLSIFIILSLLFAFISYEKIEKYNRNKKFSLELDKIKLIMIFWFIPILISGSLGLISSQYLFPKYQSGEIMGKYQGDVGAINFEKFTAEYKSECKHPSYYGDRICGAEVGLLGDSHADHLIPGFIYNFPSLSIAKLPTSLLSEALDLDSRNVEREVLSSKSLKIIIVSRYWSNNKIPVDFESQMDRLADSGKKIIILDDIPNFPFDAFSCKYGISIFIEKTVCSIDRKYFDQQKNKYFPRLEKVSRQTKNISIYLSSDLFCNRNICSMTNNTSLYYLDFNHLNRNGSILLSKRIVSDNRLFCDTFQNELRNYCN